MVQKIYLCNTDFEFELTQPNDSSSIERIWHRFPICLQLQFLPLLYADPEDAIAVTQAPDASFIEQLLQLELWQKNDLPAFIPLMNNLNLKRYKECISWGASRRVQQWANLNHINYQIPDLNLVKEVNSKLFSFTLGSALDQSSLLWNASDLEQWLGSTSGKRVLKTCFGVSGRGHYFIETDTPLSSIITFCNKEWACRRPLIAEPWVHRLFDFSTQWFLDKTKGVQLIGPTVFESNSKGAYQATMAGSEEQLFKDYLPFLYEHKELVGKCLDLIYKKGFFGYLGVDAFIYEDAKGDIRLHPLVEINARQTMSLAALRFQQRWFADRIVRLQFSSSGMKQVSLLPSKIQLGEKEVVFDRHLTFSFC